MGAAASAHAAHNRRSEDGSLDQWHTQPPADSTTAALAELERAAGGGAPARAKMIKVIFPEGPMGLVLTQSEVGLSVTSVEGAAEAAGVEPMDVVCELNGRRIGADLETGERRRTLASLGAERARSLSLSLSLCTGFPSSFAPPVSPASEHPHSLPPDAPIFARGPVAA